MNLDPTAYGLTRRTILEKYQGEIAIAVRRKSRFLRKDVALFLKKAEQIKKKTGNFPILILQAPLCSKARQLLLEQNVNLIEEHQPKE